MDENNVLKDFSVSYPGVDFSISGNKLHISTDKKEFGTITAEKELPSSIPGVVTGGTKYWLRDEMCIRDSCIAVPPRRKILCYL